MAIDREAARAAGYTDAEIDAYEAEQKNKSASSATQIQGDEPPPPSPPSATQAQNSGVDYGELATTAAMAVAPYALPAAGLAAGGYGALKVGGWGRNLAQSAKDISQAMKERTAVEAAREARMANRPGFGGTPPAGAPGPVQPAPAPAPVPQAAPAPMAKPSVDNIVRQTALDRVLKGVAPYMRAASGIGGMLYSPSLNTGEAEQLAEYRRRTGQQP